MESNSTSMDIDGALDNCDNVCHRHGWPSAPKHSSAPESTHMDLSTHTCQSSMAEPSITATLHQSCQTTAPHQEAHTSDINMRSADRFVFSQTKQWRSMGKFWYSQVRQIRQHVVSIHRAMTESLFNPMCAL